MKNQAFLARLAFAINGVKIAVLQECSFRTQIAAAGFAVAATAWISPKPIWWAVISLTIGLILAAELFNTALENTLDGLHPSQALFVKHAKDCAAGAVLLLCITALAVFMAMILDTLPQQP